MKIDSRHLRGLSPAVAFNKNSSRVSRSEGIEAMAGTDAVHLAAELVEELRASVYGQS